MKTTELKTLIKESIQEYIREVDMASTIAAQEAKIRACEEAIAIREKKINLEGLDEAMHEMIDKSKLNELKKEVKELQKYKTKAEGLLEKMKNKKEGKSAPKNTEDKDVEEAVIDEINIDETFPESGAQLEEDQLDEAKKMTAAQKEKKEDIVKGMKKSKSFGKSKEEKGKMYATATKLATKESVNEQFLHMQKLAGLITEAEYAAKKRVLNENSDQEIELTKTGQTPNTIDPDSLNIEYDVKLNGKNIGSVNKDSYFGDITGTLYGRDLPDISNWNKYDVPFPNDEADEEQWYTNNVKSALVNFLKSKTGDKWLSVLKKKTPDAFSGM